MTLAEVIDAHRGHVFGVAYRMLGTAADAEDAVQDAFVRWHNTVSTGPRSSLNTHG